MGIVLTEAVPQDQWSYGLLVSRNVVAARARARMSQASLAARMKALGYGWYAQTVGAVERGERRLEISEVLALALALETSVGALLDPSADDKLISLPSGDVILAGTVLRSVRHFNDGMVAWLDDVPRIASREPESWPETEVGDGLREEASGISEFRSEDMQERNARLWPGPYEVPSAPPRRPDRTGQRAAVVAAVVTSLAGVLVGRRNDGEPTWGFITGEIEPGERPEDAAVREVKEETGCRVRAGRVIGERIHPKTQRKLIYMAARPIHSTAIFVGDETELAEVRWVGLREVQELLPDMYEPVRDYLVRELSAGDRR